MAQTIAQLIDETTVDAYDTGEQFSGFLQVFEDEVTTPISATVIGVTIEVVGLDQEGDERRGLIARCRHPGATETVALAGVHFGPDSVAGRLHAAYRTWLCPPPFAARRTARWAWPEQ